MTKLLSKKYYLFALISLFLALPFLIQPDVVVADIKDLLNIQPEHYYGTTVDMSQILPESEKYVVDNRGKDLIDISHELGMNMMRITNITSISSKRATSSYTEEQWAEVLKKMRKKSMYAVIIAEANSSDTQFHSKSLTLDEYYINFIKEYLITSKVCHFSNVYAVNIRNEPLLNDHNIAKLKEAAQIIKTACPDTLITIGSWRTDSGKLQENGEPEYNWHDPKETGKLDAIVDIHSAHIYGFDKKAKGGNYPDPYLLTIGYINEIRKYSSKPILIEEFDAGNGSAMTDQNTLGSEELQKKAYEGVLKASYDQQGNGVVGALSYLLLARSKDIDGWAISRDNANKFLPAAYTFEQYTENPFSFFWGKSLFQEK